MITAPVPHRSKSGRATLACLAAFALLLTLLGAHPTASVSAPAPPSSGLSTAEGSTPTDHGPALPSVNVSMTAFDTLPDGTEIGYVFNSGQPISMNVINMETFELIDRHELEPWAVAASAVVDEDHSLYFSVRSPNDGSLLRYDPFDQEVTQLETGVVDETFLRSMLIRDGVLYGSTYPNGKVFSYDLATGEIRDYGPVADDVAYAWGFEEVGGNLWVGTGSTPHLREVDIQTGEISDVALPEEMYETKDFVTDIARHDDLVFVRASPAGDRNLAIYDLATGELCCADTALMGTWSTESYDDAFYYIVGSEVRGYDLNAREDFSIGWNESEMAGEQAGSQPLRVVELDREDYPGPTLMSIRQDGHLWYYNLQNRTGEVIDLQIEGSPATTQSLGIGPDGNPYVGAYLSAGLMSRLDHGTDELEVLEGPEQTDAVATVGDHLVLGTYSGAGFYSADPTQDWEWGSNPTHLFSIGREEGQDRVSDLVDANGVAAAGTIPNYGELGGALVLFDPVLGDPQIHRNIVPDHSVVSLAYADGIIYGGTSIHGGIDSDPAQGPAELFLWDLQAGELIESLVPDETADIIHTLTFDADGRLWGMTDSGTMFGFDPTDGEVVDSADTGLRNSNIWGRTSEMAQHPDGLIYGNAASRLFTFDPDTLETTRLDVTGVRYSAVHEDGTVYYTSVTNLFSYQPGSAAPACSEHVSGEHAGSLTVDEGTLCVQDATVRGSITASPGAGLVVEDSTVLGRVSAHSATDVAIRASEVRGGSSIDGTTGAVELTRNSIHGRLDVSNGTGDVVLVSGNEVRGSLRCEGNTTAPVNDEADNEVSGRLIGQCAHL